MHQNVLHGLNSCGMAEGRPGQPVLQHFAGLMKNFARSITHTKKISKCLESISGDLS